MSGCGADKHVVSTDCLRVGSETAPFPSVFKEGWRAAPGWLVKGRVASLYARAAIPIFCWKSLTTPSAPLRNGVFLFVAQPPLLGKEGNGSVSQLTIPSLPRNLWDSS